MPWLDPSLTLRWGQYQKLGTDEQLQLVQTVVAAKTAELCTKRQAIEKLAPVFGTQDVSAVLESLEEEKADKQAEDEANAERELNHAVTVAQAKGGAGPAGKAAPPSKT